MGAIPGRQKAGKSGDFVWMPVEVPGATYGVQEEQGIFQRLQAVDITWKSRIRHSTRLRSSPAMSDYLTANRKKIKAITASAIWSTAASSGCSIRLA